VSCALREQKQDRLSALLATVGMLGAPTLGIGLCVLHVPVGGRADGVLSMAFIVAWACSAIGMRRLRVTGDTRIAAVVFDVQMVGLALAFGFGLLCAVTPHPAEDSLLSRITDAAWPLSVLFNLVIGVLVLRARVWRGWARFVPLACGLSLPLGMGIGALAGRTAMEIAGLILFTGLWAALGSAVRSTATHKPE